MQTLRTQKKDYGEGQKFCYPISSGIYSYAIFPGTIYRVCAPYLKFPNSKFAIANTSGWTFAHSLAAFLCMLEIDHLPNAAIFCQTMRLHQWEVYIFCSIAFVLYLQSRFQCLSPRIWWCRNPAWTVVGYHISRTKDILLSAKTHQSAKQSMQSSKDLWKLRVFRSRRKLLCHSLRKVQIWQLYQEDFASNSNLSIKAVSLDGPQLTSYTESNALEFEWSLATDPVSFCRLEGCIWSRVSRVVIDDSYLWFDAKFLTLSSMKRLVDTTSNRCWITKLSNLHLSVWISGYQI